VPSTRDRAVDTLNEAGARALQVLERLITRASLVPTTPFLDPRTFPWVGMLEENWRTIRAELDEVLTYREQLPNFQDISTDQESITDDDRWKTFFLYGYGFKSEPNCARCPRTTALLEQVPGMTTAFFSILSPHKHIPDHRGPYKGVLRYHLALKIPEPREACRIRVDGEYATWEEGGSLLFDDSYEHEAWNDTDGIRVVLFMDVIRPLKAPVRQINDFVIRAISKSPYIGDAKRRHLDWEMKFEELRNRR
jgi:aspartyl/asparaginyl beta-hydroxylase (cupin superfamily)